MNKKDIGYFGEVIAKKYLEKNGYAILETNWHHHHKELDIIAYKKILVGFEIKTRTTGDTPSFTLLKAKQVARLRTALKAYCGLKGFNYDFSRLDLIVITKKDKNSLTIKHHLDI